MRLDQMINVSSIMATAIALDVIQTSDPISPRHIDSLDSIINDLSYARDIIKNQADKQTDKQGD